MNVQEGPPTIDCPQCGNKMVFTQGWFPPHFFCGNCGRSFSLSQDVILDFIRRTQEELKAKKFIEEKEKAWYLLEGNPHVKEPPRRPNLTVIKGGKHE